MIVSIGLKVYGYCWFRLDFGAIKIMSRFWLYLYIKNFFGKFSLSCRCSDTEIICLRFVKIFIENEIFGGFLVGESDEGYEDYSIKNNLLSIT